MRKKTGLVSVVSHQFFRQVAGQQVRRVGFQHDPIQGDFFHCLLQVFASSLITYPARDTDVHVHFEISTDFCCSSGKTMHHCISHKPPVRRNMIVLLRWSPSVPAHIKLLWVPTSSMTPRILSPICVNSRATPHVAQNDTNRRSAIDGRTTRHTGYAISQRVRKRIEEIFGWSKDVGPMRKTKFWGKDRIGFQMMLTFAGYTDA